MKHKNLVLILAGMGGLSLIGTACFLEAMHFRHLVHAWKATDPDHQHAAPSASASVSGRVSGLRLTGQTASRVRLTSTAGTQWLPLSRDGRFASGPIAAGVYRLELVGSQRVSLTMHLQQATEVAIELADDRTDYF